MKEEKNHRPIVKLLHFNYLVVPFDMNFGVYSKGRKQVTQLILNMVWKNVYMAYEVEHFDSPFQEETWKDKL
jgi:hypothetical protein